MITITINRHKYRGVYSWQDITLQKFCQLASIPMPEGYESFILADGRYDFEKKDSVNNYVDTVSKLTDKQINEDFPAYYRQVIECLTNIPYKKIALLSTEDVNTFYEYYFKPFVVSILYNKPVIHFMGQLKDYQPEEFKKVRLGLFKTFRLPESVNIMDQDIPLAKEPIITYTEASDIFRGLRITKDDVKRLALFMAIYCRKKDERYDERKALQRQSIFMKAPMSVVWSVFFYIVRHLPDSTMIILLFGKLPRTTAEIVQGAKTYRNTAAEDLSTKQPVMEDLAK